MLSPFIVLLLGTILVVTLIVKLRFHPFIALIISSVFIGIMASGNLPKVDGEPAMITAVNLPMLELGTMAGKLAWVIVLAALIGAAMMESGAAGRIVEWLLELIGEKQAAVALLLSGFILSIPVFFDTVFFLLIPLGITLARRTGKNYILYISAIAGGAVISHSIVPPTPGPIIMAETLGIDLGISIIAGVVGSIIPAIFVIIIGRNLNKYCEIPMRVEYGDDAGKGSSPSIQLSLLPVVVPIIMISAVTVIEVMTGSVSEWVLLQGNKNVAMAVGAIIALWLWAHHKSLTAAELWKGINKPFEMAGTIILITSAGGAFGAMIKHIGISESIKELTAGFEINYILLAWIIAAVMKIAQGSGTVAVITASAIIAGIIEEDVTLPYHPVYLFLAVGFGSFVLSWMNDSGFWVVTKMTGMTEKEGFLSWTLLLALLGVVGLVQLLIVSRIFPLI